MLDNNDIKILKEMFAEQTKIFDEKLDAQYEDRLQKLEEEVALHRIAIGHMNQEIEKLKAK